MQTLMFPLRLQPSGLLRRQQHTASLVDLLQAMARTPAGSWKGCPKFGLRDLFEESRNRADVPRLATERINEVLADLGLEQFVVTEVVRELSSQRETDTWALTISNRANQEESFTTVVSRQI